MKKLNLNENFISRIWQEKSYYKDLKTTNGKDIEVLEYGKVNSDTGADYKNARVRIDGLIYYGDIEIHKSLSDWKSHNHKSEGKYNKVILQVVFWDDEKMKLSLPLAKGSREISTVILSKFLTKSIHDIWKEIINNPSPAFKLPCNPYNDKILTEDKLEILKITGMRRLNYRTDRIHTRLKELVEKGYSIKNSKLWERLLFEFVCEALGFSKNKKQFLRFADILNINKLSSLELNLTQTDSVFFGTAGFLHNLKFRDTYIEKLKSNWEILNKELRISPMDKSEWNFFRLRPQNFPTLRIAFASALFKEITEKNLLKKVFLIFENEKNITKKTTELFRKIGISEYWNSHYNFGKSKKAETSIIGNSRITDIIVNVILPLIHLYAKIFEKSGLKEKAKEFYLNTKPISENEITSVMQKQLVLKVKRLVQQQGLIHLHNFLCVKGKCDECEIGSRLFVNEKRVDYLTIIFY